MIRASRIDGLPAWRHDAIDPLALEFKCSAGHVTRIERASFVVDDQGRVAPALGCSVKACGFYDYVQLDKWDGGREWS